MNNSAHVSEKDLIRFTDGEIETHAAREIEAHLQQCDQCRRRIEELNSGASAYAEYHAHVLKPSLASSRAWPRLDFSVERKVRSSPVWITAFATACGLALLALFFFREMPHHRMTQLLVRASAVQPVSHRRLRVNWNGRNWYRPAVLAAASQTEDSGLAHARSLFVQANYSWDDPLSARSFAAWRNQLHDKRDQVVSFRSEDGSARFYRLRTDTSQGVLRTASLTLRADTLHAVEGRFNFEHDENVTMIDSGDIPVIQPMTVAKNPFRHKPAIETKATPQDELRVFAALSSIGADTGDPLTVEMDPAQRHIVISGVGIPDARERQIRQALVQIPNATTRFSDGQPPPPRVRGNTHAENNSAATAPLRHVFEAKAGGAQQFEEIADRALDASSALLEQAHALAVLAQSFPPPVAAGFGTADQATLRGLRRRHAVAMQQSIADLRHSLAPLLTPAANPENSNGTHSPPQSSWQTGATQLLAISRTFDASLSRLLAGSYSQAAGEDILSKLPDEIRSLEDLAREQTP